MPIVCFGDASAFSVDAALGMFDVFVSRELLAVMVHAFWLRLGKNGVDLTLGDATNDLDSEMSARMENVTAVALVKFCSA